jgi:hypothetical protein
MPGNSVLASSDALRRWVEIETRTKGEVTYGAETGD